MVMPTGKAAGAYSNAAQLIKPLAGDSATGGGLTAAQASGANSGEAFGNMVRDSLNSVVETGKAADAGMNAVAAGKASVVDVVTAVAEAEVTLNTMVSVRDRVIRAYQEIMQMPI